MTPTRRDRGQLVLVGAVSIALVLMGLVAVFNTVLFTETTAPTESIESSAEARSLSYQVRNDTRELMFWVANASGTDASNFPTRFASNMSTYSEGLSNSYAQTGPVYVNVSASASDTTWIGSSPGTLATDVKVVYRTRTFEYNTTINVTRPAPSP